MVLALVLMQNLQTAKLFLNDIHGSIKTSHQDYFDLLEYMTHLNHVIYEEKQNFMEIVMVGVSKPEMDRHISKKFQKPEKKLDI